MNVFTEGDIRIEFPDGLRVRKFDDEKVHGRNDRGMKAVDFVVEFPDRYIFIEVKDPETLNALKNVKGLVRKFRDSFIYEWAEKRADKPIVYIVLVALDGITSAELTVQSDGLRRMLPELGPFDRRWKRPLVKSCEMMNLAAWNQNALTRQFPAARIPAKK